MLKVLSSPDGRRCGQMPARDTNLDSFLTRNPRSHTARDFTLDARAGMLAPTCAQL